MCLSSVNKTFYQNITQNCVYVAPIEDTGIGQATIFFTYYLGNILILVVIAGLLYLITRAGEGELLVVLPAVLSIFGIGFNASDIFDSTFKPIVMMIYIAFIIYSIWLHNHKRDVRKAKEAGYY
jgi:hypothetical protein